MTQILGVIVGVLIFFGAIALFGLKGLLYTCSPNEVLIFSGRRRREGGRTYGFRVIKGGTGLRVPLFERVYKMDLSNMAIDMTAQNAYSKGGIPLTVQGVANVKIAGHEPLLNNAIERFLGKSRAEVMQIAKATLEGALRGILATMTPEQVNEDKLTFAERLVAEVEQDMTNLGLVVDTMKIQNVQDEVKYLESIGRQRGATVIKTARVSEAIAKADSVVRSAENAEKENRANLSSKTNIARAEAQTRLTDVQTRRAALIAEEQAQVQAMVAQAEAEIEVQKARLEQTRSKLEADIVAPARAEAEAAEARAKAATASIIEDARARAEALRKLAETWNAAGSSAREVLVAQKLETVVKVMADLIPNSEIDKVTLLGKGGTGGMDVGKMLSAVELGKQVFGVDLVEKVKAIGEPRPVRVAGPEAPRTVEAPLAPHEAPHPARRRDGDD